MDHVPCPVPPLTADRTIQTIEANCIPCVCLKQCQFTSPNLRRATSQKWRHMEMPGAGGPTWWETWMTGVWGLFFDIVRVLVGLVKWPDAVNYSDFGPAVTSNDSYPMREPDIFSFLAFLRFSSHTEHHRFMNLHFICALWTSRVTVYLHFAETEIRPSYSTCCSSITTVVIIREYAAVFKCYDDLVSKNMWASKCCLSICMAVDSSPIFFCNIMRFILKSSHFQDDLQPWGLPETTLSFNWFSNVIISRNFVANG